MPRRKPAPRADTAPLLITPSQDHIGASQALDAERARLYEAEQRARAIAEAAQHRQAALAEASRLFAEASLDLQELLNRITRQVAERIGDFCAIRLISADGQRLEMVALYHSNPDARALVAAAQSLHYRVDEGFMGQVVQTGQALCIPVLNPDEARRGINLTLWTHLDQIGLYSLLMVPLRVGGEVIGAVGATRSTPGWPYTEEDQVFLQDLADRAALAIDHARLYAAERQARAAAERAAERTAQLQAVAASLARALTPAQVAEVIAAQGVAALEAHAGLVALIDEGLAELEIISAAGYPQAYTTPFARFSLHAPLPLSEVARTGAALWFETGAEMVARYPALSDSAAPDYGGAFAALPLRLEDRLIGVFSLRFARPRSFAAEDQAMMLTLAQHCAQALERARLYREAQEAIRLRDVFFSIAAHEFKTPLTSLYGQAQLLQRRAEREGSLSERDRRSITVVVAQASRLNQMVTAMLDVSRLELGKLSIERADLDLGALTRRVVEEIQPTLSQHTVVCEGPDGPLPVAGDALRLEQVLQNLIGNAVKYSPFGGLVQVQLARCGSMAWVTVQDHGIGIPAAALPQLFQRFYRAANVDEQQISGMGIGLYVVKEIVTLHGGSVSVESVEGQGSTFTISLPITDDKMTR